MRRRVLAIVICFISLSFQCNLSGQDSLSVSSELNQRRYTDSLFSVRLLQRSLDFIAANQPDSAFSSAGRSVSIAGDHGFSQAAAKGYEILASLSSMKNDWEETLRNYLKASEAYRKSGDKIDEARVLGMIASDYLREGIYKKAALYYEQEYALYDETDLPRLASSAESAGKSYFNLSADSLAAVWYNKAGTYYNQLKNTDGIQRCREKLGLLYTRLGLFDKALEEYTGIINFYSPGNDYKSIASAFNQAGYVMFRKKDIDGALEKFTNGVQYSEKAGDDFLLTELWSNIAICWQNLGNETQMLSSFRKALDYARKSGRTDEAGRIERIMAVTYFNKGDNYHAELYCLDCIESSKASGNLEQLHLCYHDYSNVLESGNDFIKALEYYEKYLNLRDSLNYENRLAEKNNAVRIAGFETTEQRIKEEVAAAEIEDLELKTLRAENLRRENEINLLINKQQLERSEKERIAQSLLLEKEKNITRENQEKVRSLEQEARIQQQELDLKTEKERTLTAENRLLETQKNQEIERGQKARVIRNMAVILGALMVLVAIMILFGLISSRRKNQKLAESKRQIEKINYDLERTNAEVINQKDIIEQKNQAITDSILYAGRIQTAVLPPVNFIDEWGLENFIMFRPKDIVSGDFYWGVRKNEKIIIAAADCTGHGVPGAFMSMLGHAFLDEIINTREVEDAASILNFLRDEIINALRQKGNTGEARDGMDISLIILDLKEGKLDYAGANNPLYLIRNGRLIKHMPDRMPIGIHFISFTSFTNQKLEIFKGDRLYLFSDGYADQFGGPKGKKFMYKPFQDLLLENSSKPMNTQKKILEESFDKWKGEREQVDDVMIIGLSV
jgi:serine phosphatase RsbU (regulator of sigma subunit)